MHAPRQNRRAPDALEIPNVWNLDVYECHGEATAKTKLNTNLSTGYEYRDITYDWNEPGRYCANRACSDGSVNRHDARDTQFDGGLAIGRANHRRPEAVPAA